MLILNSPDSSFNSNFITVQYAAKYSGYNPQYIRRLLRNGKLEGIKIGQVWLIAYDSLLEYIKEVKITNDLRFGPRIKD